MSRYTIPGAHLNHITVVGYDAPMETYFGHVYDLSVPTGKDHAIVWVGTKPHEITTVEALQARLSGYVTLTKEQGAILRDDKAASEPPTPLQRMILRWIEASV